MALDLLWNMEAPYKWTMAAMIAIVLITGVASARAAAPASYAWFAMGMVIFVGRNFELTLSLQVCVAIAVYISGAPDLADFFKASTTWSVWNSSSGWHATATPSRASSS